MSQPIASTATRAPALRDQDRDRYRDERQDRQDRHDPPARPSKVWALMEAMAYAGAFIDPTGILTVQRLRRAYEEELHANR